MTYYGIQLLMSVLYVFMLFNCFTVSSVESRRNSDDRNGAKKKFELFENVQYNFTKAKLYCKEKEGQLAQASNMDEMVQIYQALAKGKKTKAGVWIGTGTKDWRNMGYHSNTRGSDMIEGDQFGMCPTMRYGKQTIESDPCFKNLPFICEFPIKKSKPSTQTSTTKKPKKKRAKNEMRRK